VAGPCAGGYRFSLVELVNERTGTSVLLEGMEAKEYAELSEEEVRLAALLEAVVGVQSRQSTALLAL
jgi:hypothetical protein